MFEVENFEGGGAVKLRPPLIPPDATALYRIFT